MLIDVLRIALAILAGVGVIYVGLTILRVLSQSQPDPPPAGSLRKVKLEYRCSICGVEIQLRISPVEDPEPPKHCGEEMNLQVPIDD